MPKTWDEFFAAADKLKAAGLVPVAHGGQNWQDFTTFESVVLGVGGAKFYQDALVKLDDKAINSDTMKKSLETFRRIKTYTDPGAPGRDWNLATAMLIQGKAGFQLMGDWAKGEFLAANKTPGKDFQCAAAPGSANAFTFNVDSFILFKLKDAAAQKAQSDLASAIMSPEFQEVFNLNKGSIPVRAPARRWTSLTTAPSCLGQGLCRHRQERWPGAQRGPRHGDCACHRRRHQGRRQPVLERRQGQRRRCHEEDRGRREDQVSRVRHTHPHALKPTPEGSHHEDKKPPHGGGFGRRMREWRLCYGRSRL